MIFGRAEAQRREGRENSFYRAEAQRRKEEKRREEKRRGIKVCFKVL
jgi:hypothetical protein